MKTLLSIGLASILGLAAVSAHAVRQPVGAEVLARHFALVGATDDPAPVDCPLCGGDATLHKRIVGSLELTTTQAIFGVMDNVWF
jgi:hypothetical protein